MNTISGLDSSWQFPTLTGLQAFKRGGGQAVFGYLSGDPTKNWTPARLKLVHSQGLGAGMNFESYAGRAKEGYAAGHADGVTAWNEIAALIKAVGYGPKSHLHVYASADFDAQPSQFPAIDAYLRGFASALLAAHANADQAVYGSYALVVHTAGAGTSKAEWQTYAWSGGRFFTGSEYYQWSNGHNAFGGTVDYDQVISLANLGAWWPPGHPLDKGLTVPPTVPPPVVPPKPGPAVLHGIPPTVYLVDITTVPKGVPWPGDFTNVFGGYTHIVDGTQGLAIRAAYGASGLVYIKISYAQHLAITGGTP